MDPLGFHITLRLVPDRNIAPSPEARRLLARTIAAVARPFPVLAFRWADTHGHVLAVCTRAVAGELARRIEIALQHALKPGVPFARAHFTPILDLAHLRSAFLYILRQDARHGLGNDPFHEASNLLDLLGARLIASWMRAYVREYIARLTRADLLAIAGWDGAPATAPRLEAAVLDAAAAALALPDLDGNGADAVRARRAVVELFPSATTRGIAGLLSMTPQGIRRLRRAAPDPDVVSAIQLQLGLRGRLVTDPVLGKQRPANEMFDGTSLRTEPGQVGVGPRTRQ